MDRSKIDETVKKLQEINDVLSKLDPAIRSDAFEILRNLYFEDNENSDSFKKIEKVAVDTTSRDKFYGSFNHELPKDNLYLIIAWLFSQYGVFSITTKMVKNEADEVGITIPDRPDATMRIAKHEGKLLFKKQGKGYSLTVSGQQFLKNEFRIKKGTKSLPDESAD